MQYIFNSFLYNFNNKVVIILCPVLFFSSSYFSPSPCHKLSLVRQVPSFTGLAEHLLPLAFSSLIINLFYPFMKYVNSILSFFFFILHYTLLILWFHILSFLVWFNIFLKIFIFVASCLSVVIVVWSATSDAYVRLGFIIYILRSLTLLYELYLA